MTDNNPEALAELKPCPFCGGDELSHGWSAPGIDGSATTGEVQCHTCEALLWKETEAEAIAAWNTRPSPTRDAVADGEGVDQCGLEQAGWDWLDQMISALCDEHPSDIAYSADQMVDAFAAGVRHRLRTANTGRAGVLEEAASKARDDGATFVLERLGEALGVDDWSICDGTEEWEGDVSATLWSILRKADVIDDDDNSVARHAAIRARTKES